MQFEGSGGGPILVFKEVFATTEVLSPRHEVARSAGPAEPREKQPRRRTWMPRAANETFRTCVLCLGKSIFAGFLRN